MALGAPVGRRRWIIGLTVGLFCLLALPPLPAADASLSFNLERSEDRSEDFPLVFYMFRCGSKRYTFNPPASWTITGDAASMSFSTLTSDGDAVARFRVSSSAELALLNPEQKARREPALRQFLPSGVTDLHQVGTENSNPAPVLAHKGAEIVYRFNFFGHAMKASVMICQLDEKNGFTLITIASAEVWENFIAQVRRTLGAVGVTEDKSPTHFELEPRDQMIEL